MFGLPSPPSRRAFDVGGVGGGSGRDLGRALGSPTRRSRRRRRRDGRVRSRLRGVRRYARGRAFARRPRGVVPLDVHARRRGRRSRGRRRAGRARREEEGDEGRRGRASSRATASRGSAAGRGRGGATRVLGRGPRGARRRVQAFPAGDALSVLRGAASRRRAAGAFASGRARARVAESAARRATATRAAGVPRAPARALRPKDAPPRARAPAPKLLGPDARAPLPPPPPAPRARRRGRPRGTAPGRAPRAPGAGERAAFACRAREGCARHGLLVRDDVAREQDDIDVASKKCGFFCFAGRGKTKKPRRRPAAAAVSARARAAARPLRARSARASPREPAMTKSPEPVANDADARDAESPAEGAAAPRRLLRERPPRGGPRRDAGAAREATPRPTQGKQEQAQRRAGGEGATREARARRVASDAPRAPTRLEGTVRSQKDPPRAHPNETSLLSKTN